MKTKSYFSNIWVAVVKKRRGLSGHTTLKFVVSQESIDKIGLFFNNKQD